MTGRQEILVTVASKHGATAEIAEHLAEQLRRGGHPVTVTAPDAVRELSTYRAIVLGSAVYMGHWMDDARDLATRIARVETPPMVWLFSSGPVGDPPKPAEDPVDVAEIYETTRAIDHRVFAGKIDKSKLTFGERAMMTAVRAPEGDFREWEEISHWADSISTLLADSLKMSS